MSLFQITIFIYLANIIRISAQMYIISCTDASECRGQTVLTDGTVHCGGAFSCQNASNITAPQFLFCDGSNACSNSVIKSDGDIYCRGSNSCSHSNIKGNITTTDLTCSGYLSCARSYILNSKRVYGYGAYSFYNATIESADGVFDIYLSGYFAGFGTKIICHSNNTCNIRCYFNGCYMTYLDCDESSECNIYTYNTDGIRPITDVSLLDLSINTQHLFEEETTNNDKECNDNTKSMSFDIESERSFFGTMDISNAQQLCCRGYTSCQYNHIIYNGNTTNTKLICSGGRACYQSNISSNNAVSCEGASSCEGPQIISTITYIRCLGYRSCDNKEIYNAINVTCAGSYSCWSLNLYTSGLGKTHNIYFIGDSSGESSNIYCETNDECFILCGGYRSCYNAQLICNGSCTVECGEGSKCPITSGSSFVTIIPPQTSQITSEPTLSPNTVNPTVNSTANPTVNPTVSPTVNPTVIPTVNPTLNPTLASFISRSETSQYIVTMDFIFGIHISLHFEYESIAVNVSINITHKIDIILSDIIYDEINRNLNEEMVANCIGNIDELIINETKDDGITVNVRIPTCNKQIEQQLLIIYNTNNKLQRDFIDSFERETHLTVIGDIYITFDTIKPRDIDSIKTESTNIESTKFNHEYDDTNQNDNVMLIIFGCVFGFILMICAAFKCYQRYKKQQLQKISKSLEDAVASSDQQKSNVSVINPEQLQVESSKKTMSNMNQNVNMVIGEADEEIVDDDKDDDTSSSHGLYIKQNEVIDAEGAQDAQGTVNTATGYTQSLKNDQSHDKKEDGAGFTNTKGLNETTDDYDVHDFVADYRNWNATQIAYWIITLDPAKFGEYENMLTVTLHEEQVNGHCLSNINESDLKRWGITNVHHIQELLNHIARLIEHKEADKERYKNTIGRL